MMEFIEFLLKKNPLETAAIILISIVYGVSAGLFAPLVLAAASDIVAGKSYWIWFVCLFGCVVIQLLSYWNAETRATKLVADVLERMVIDLADVLRRDELPNFERRDRAEIRLSLEATRDIAEGAVASLRVFQSLVTVFVLCLSIFYFSGPAGLLFLFVFLMIIMIFEIVLQLSRDRGIQVAGIERDLFSVFHHFLDGFKEIKIDAGKNRDLFGHHLKPIIHKIKEYRFRLSVINTDFGICLQTSIFILMGAFAFILPAFGVDVPILALVACTLYAIKPSVVALVVSPKIGAAQASLARLQKFSGKKDDEHGTGGPVYRPESVMFEDFDILALRDARFNYFESNGAQSFSIGPLTLTIAAGEILFIAGGNGSGKSTLLKVLTGLYPLDAGTASINAKDVRLSKHRYLFSAIFSDFHLFDRLYGVDNLDEDRVDELLRKMQLDGKTSFSEGRFTNLNLSAGQRRRLALVAALPEDKLIYVFDEWAADQDPRFRRYFYETLLPSLKKQGKTVIVVTHDDHYYRLADRVIFMKDGRIVDEWDSATGDRFEAIPLAGPSTSSLFKTKRKKDRGGIDAKAQPDTSAGPDEAVSDQDAPSILDLRKYKPLFIKLGCMMIAQGLSVIFILHILFKAVDAQYASSEIRLFFLFIILLLINIHLGKRIETIVSDTLENVSGNVRIAIIDRVRKIGLAFFETIGIGPIYTSLTTDMKTLTDSFRMLLSSFQYLIRFTFLLAYFAFLVFPLFVVSMAIGGVMGVFFIQNQMRIKKNMGMLKGREIAFFDSVTHLLDGFKELRLNDRKNDSFFYDCVKTIASEVSDLKLTASKYMSLNTMLVYGPWTALLALIPLAYPMSEMSPNAMFMCVGVISFLPINSIVLLIPPLTLATNSAGRIKQLMNILDEAEQDLIDATPAEDRMAFQTLQCNDLTFRYINRNGDDSFAVGPMNLTFSSGELIYITGGNGSGKSTLIKLVTGLYRPDSGKILLNGQPADIRRHRYLFSVIFSDFHLFDRLYGIPDADPSRVEELIHLMQLQGKVTFEDGKFSTLDLSTGQKKRLALVMAMMEDRPVYIFDEWAAEQDPYFRRYFYEILLPGFKADGKSVIAVTHHDQYFHLADRVVKMEYGRVV